MSNLFTQLYLGLHDFRFQMVDSQLDLVSELLSQGC